MSNQEISIFARVNFTETQKEKSISVIGNAESLLKEINNLPDSIYKSIATTKLEECVMWANKAISRG